VIGAACRLNPAHRGVGSAVLFVGLCVYICFRSQAKPATFNLHRPTAPSEPRSNRRDQLILRSKRLNDPSSPVAGIDLITSIDQAEGFKDRHISLDRFSVSPQRR
jgi:hypothetical protein